MPASNSSHAGTASSTWLITSGGVRNMPTTKQPTITYGRLRAMLRAEVSPVLANRNVATGISKAMPKAKNIFSTKSR